MVAHRLERARRRRSRYGTWNLQQQIKPAGRPYPPLNIFTDGASLLWRLRLAGKDGLEPHWRDVAAYGEQYFPQAGAHFADVHHALAAAALAATRWTRDWRNWKPAPPTASSRPAAPAIDICRGIKAFADGDNDGAIRLLEPAMAELVRIGGSHAQRELWEDTLSWPICAAATPRRRPT